MSWEHTVKDFAFKDDYMLLLLQEVSCLRDELIKWAQVCNLSMGVIYQILSSTPLTGTL